MAVCGVSGMWDGKFTQENTDESKEDLQMKNKDTDKINREELIKMLKGDLMTKGIKVGDPAIEHLEYLLNNHNHWEAPTLNAIRFYVMGYAAGVQTEKLDEDVRKR